MASSAPPDLNASSAAATAAVVASVAAASVARTGHDEVTSVSAMTDTAPSESRTCTPTMTTSDSEARPPGSVPSYSDQGTKIFERSTFSSPLRSAR